MCSSNVNGEGKRKKGRKGLHPAPLRVKRESHVLRKATSSGNVATGKPRRRSGQHLPLVIYADSPKVIRTEPHNFMSLVQRLTGLSNPREAARQEKEEEEGEKRRERSTGESSGDEKESSLAMTDENSSDGGVMISFSSLLSPVLDAVPDDHYLGEIPDIPLFSPNSGSILLAPSPLYRYENELLFP